jgi:hypothetical protein
MIVAVDFDGTCVTHEFPEIGRDIGAVPVLKDLVRAGHQLILFTMRSDIENPRAKGQAKIIPKGGDYLTDAVNWFRKNGIPLYGVNTNPAQKSWTHSPKAYAQLYIDDASLGCPLIINPEMSDRPFVSWVKVRRELTRIGVL